jgi:uncharacterized protein (UPF0548 family)
MDNSAAPDAVLLARLQAITAMESTIDVAARDSYTTKTGWYVDQTETMLTAEAPGDPLPDGAYAAAKSILNRYAFPPPQLIRGRFDSRVPLQDRVMLLTAHYLWMTFELPVRVSRVIDLRRDSGDGPEQVWGYSYQTLKGHMERGEITFEVIKRIATGSVLFRIHSYSQAGYISNVFYRIGFRLVGRRLQRRFATQSLRNMQRMVAQDLLQRSHE